MLDPQQQQQPQGWLWVCGSEHLTSLGQATSLPKLWIVPYLGCRRGGPHSRLPTALASGTFWHHQWVGGQGTWHLVGGSPFLSL